MLQKYFIAIVPPEPLQSKMQSVKQAMFETYGTKGALRSPAHITLHMPFSWEERKEDKLIQSLRDFRFPASFTLQLNGYGCFEPRVVFIQVEENELLTTLQKQLVSYAKSNLQLFNQADDMRGFHPHVTVAFRDLKKPVFYRIWDDYQRQSFQADFNCGTFCLLKHNEQQWNVYEEFTFCQ